MFGFFKKDDKKGKLPVEKEILYSPANGVVVPVSDVADPVFSQKMMGDGFAVIPADGNIYSPAKGKVLSVFPTKHAVGILLDSGLELLLHMGLDTVELNGKPFEIFVKEGQALTADTSDRQSRPGATAGSRQRFRDGRRHHEYGKSQKLQPGCNRGGCRKSRNRKRPAEGIISYVQKSFIRRSG